MIRITFLPMVLILVFGIAAVGQEPTSEDWAQYNYDNRAWRFNTAESTLSPESASQLVEKWRFPSRDSSRQVGAIHATPVVVNGFVYVSSAKQGVLYKLSPSGKLVWEFRVPPQNVKYEAKPSEEIHVPITEAGVMGWKIANSPLVTEKFTYLVTVDGQVFCLNRFDGKQVWSLNTRTDPFPEPHIGNSIWSSPIIAAEKLIVAGGSLEQGLAGDPQYECCTGRGFVVSLKPDSGDVLWKYNVGPEPQKLEPVVEVDYGPLGKVKYSYGPATSTVWSTPSFDDRSGLIFFGTDTNNSPRQPTEDDARRYNKYSCAIIAVDVDSGDERWVRQLVKNDVWHSAVPAWDATTGQYKDMSIGDSPKIYDTYFDGGWRQVVGAGCKNGSYYVIDRATGDLLHNTPIYTGPPEPERVAEAKAGILALPSNLGGLQTGCAFDGKRVYVNGIDWLGVVKGSLMRKIFYYAPSGGRVTALRPNALAEFWRHERKQLAIPRLDQSDKLQIAGDPVASGIAVANGVCFFSTTVSRKLVAVAADSGKLLGEYSLPEPTWCGPSVSRGRVYIGTGSVMSEPPLNTAPDDYRFSFPFEAAGAVYSYGLPRQDQVDQLPETEG